MTYEYDDTNKIGILPSNDMDDIPVSQPTYGDLNATVVKEIPGDGVQVTKSINPHNTATVLHTVTAAKTFYLTMLSVNQINQGVAADNGHVTVRNNSAVHQYYICMLRAQPNECRNRIFTFNPPLELAAGWDILVTSGLAFAYMFTFCHGYEK